ncbi:HNH endonuclease [Streptomyces olivoreticuli]|uniref:HNH endonuclease n=1 Tax=Streptomyces olivoreticuli TaxID=68246 RepID=UPI00265B09F4|nr:HNH endonuclease [Streptomyces olivoreticuli]WKK26556.1 HNH endonuclease [Streptomyces olivoreticuli]
MSNRRRPCLDCGILTRNPSRCDAHQAEWQARQDRIRGSATQRGYGSAWQRTRAPVLAAHRRQYGDWCHGWGVPAHAASDLTADHVVPKSRGGTDTPGNLAVLCRSCNSRKHNHE